MGFKKNRKKKNEDEKYYIYILYYYIIITWLLGFSTDFKIGSLVSGYPGSSSQNFLFFY
jgi:hypothetical protein